jgi:hypothetical protein
MIKIILLVLIAGALGIAVNLLGKRHRRLALERENERDSPT